MKCYLLYVWNMTCIFSFMFKTECEPYGYILCEEKKYSHVQYVYSLLGDSTHISDKLLKEVELLV